MPRDSLPDRDLARLLDEQIDAMQAVLTALDAERLALAQRDADALLKAVSDKTSTLSNADGVEARRQQLLERMGLADRGRHARSFAADAGVSQRWQQVLALTEQCRALNDANGQFIRGRQRRVDGALRLLRGESAPVEYGPGGERRAHRPSRSLGSI
jgi:flagellar biosynthesis protein FlgN